MNIKDQFKTHFESSLQTNHQEEQPRLPSELVQIVSKAEAVNIPQIQNCIQVNASQPPQPQIINNIVWDSPSRWYSWDPCALNHHQIKQPNSSYHRSWQFTNSPTKSRITAYALSRTYTSINNPFKKEHIVLKPKIFIKQHTFLSNESNITLQINPHKIKKPRKPNNHNNHNKKSAKDKQKKQLRVPKIQQAAKISKMIQFVEKKIIYVEKQTQPIKIGKIRTNLGDLWEQFPPSNSVEEQKKRLVKLSKEEKNKLIEAFENN